MIYLDFEKNIKELDAKIKELEDTKKPTSKRLEKLKEKKQEELKKIYSNLYQKRIYMIFMKIC